VIHKAGFNNTFYYFRDELVCALSNGAISSDLE